MRKDYRRYAGQSPARREAELRHAAAIIGISPVHLLDYRDRCLEDAPPDRIREELVRLVRLHRPLIDPLFREADQGSRELVTSALTLLEVLVVPSNRTAGGASISSLGR